MAVILKEKPLTVPAPEPTPPKPPLKRISRIPLYQETPQQVGVEALNLGSRGHFWGDAAEQWEPSIKALDTVWSTRGTIPVSRAAYLPEHVNFITESGRSGNWISENAGTAGDQYFKTFGFEKEGDRFPTENLGMYRNVNHYQFEGKSRTNKDARELGLPEPYQVDDRIDRPTLAITDLGWQAMQPIKPIIKTNKFNNLTRSPMHLRPYDSVGMHEIAHYLDSVIGLGGWSGSELMDRYQAESNNHPFHQGEQNWNKDTLYDAWMNDPLTEHLDLNNPDNTGLRELLSNRGHHGGVVNPREGFGEYIATALTDPGYKQMNKPSWRVSQEHSDYKMQPMEKFARLSASTLRPMIENEGFTSMTHELDKTFADSLATYLNSEYLQNQRE